jgi:hypothetical protein
VHCGSLTTNSAAARVYRVLQEARGEWVGGFELTLKAETSAVSTRVSECNHQLMGERIECERRGAGFFYRLVAVNEQLGLDLGAA